MSAAFWVFIGLLAFVLVTLLTWAIFYVGARGEREFADRIDAQIERREIEKQLAEIERAK